MKKGFTMIELLAVFTIAGVILLIAFPQITSLLRKSTNDEYKTYEKNIFIACEAYIEEQNTSLAVGESRNIKLNVLVSSGFLKSSLKNPENNKTVVEYPNTNYSVKVTKNEDGVLEYNIVK